MKEILNKIQALGIVPVVKIEDLEKAVPLARALCEGGLPCAEITFRTAEAEEAIKRITTALPDMLVGAGTILTIEQVDKAVAAGAKFIVSPGFNEKVVKYCVDKGIVITPGCINPSDIERAIEIGLDTVKFFPAEAAGGLNMIKSLAAPYVNIKFMPTGGINSKNLNDYLAFPKIIACGGSWMVKEDLINEGKFDEIRSLTKDAVEKMLGFEIGHVGINAMNEDMANGIATSFEDLFGFVKEERNGAIFVGSAVEVTKTPYLGEKGHIAIKTNYIHRAISYLESKGYEFDMETARYDAKGKLALIYLKAQVGGFAIHLLQKR